MKNNVLKLFFLYFSSKRLLKYWQFWDTWWFYQVLEIFFVSVCLIPSWVFLVLRDFVFQIFVVFKRTGGIFFVGVCLIPSWVFFSFGGLFISGFSSFQAYWRKLLIRLLLNKIQIKPPRHDLWCVVSVVYNILQSFKLANS